MYSFIEILRAIAVMLITNSHFDGVYPWNISWGGCPGVSLFFSISGFLLVSSVKKQDFFPWWLKKVLRLYIPLTIVNIVTVIIGFRSASISLFLFPIMINLWYVPCVAVLYIPYYMLLKKSVGGGYRLCVILLTVVAYTGLYFIRFRNEFFVEPEVWFRALCGFIAMLIGSLIYDIRESKLIKSKRFLLLIMAAFMCGSFLIMKLLMNRVSILINFQFMTQVFGVAFAAFMMLTGIGYEEEIEKLMRTMFGKLFEIISKCSLEIYLVQFAIIYYMKKVIFPLNLVAIVLIVTGTAFVVHQVSNMTNKLLISRIER